MGVALEAEIEAVNYKLWMPALTLQQEQFLC